MNAAPKLFNDQLIMSIAFDQSEILQSIMDLYTGRFDCDVTYNKGSFYKKVSGPRLKFDIAPQRSGVTAADYRKLPVEDKSIQSLVWDPPFVCGTHVKSEMYVMGDRYSMYDNIKALQDDYTSAISEFSKKIRGGGFLIVKCQDTVHGRRNYFNHIFVHDRAVESGFKPIDLFILLSKNRFSSVTQQNHARKFHSYFWVFKRNKK